MSVGDRLFFFFVLDCVVFGFVGDSMREIRFRFRHSRRAVQGLPYMLERAGLDVQQGWYFLVCWQ